MPSKATGDPTATPISASEFKTHHLIPSGDTSQDSSIAIYIEAARQYVEHAIERTLVDTARLYWSSCFHDEIILPFGPVASITSVKYYDTNGDDQTVAGTIYREDLDEDRIYRISGQSWPSVQIQRHNAVRIVYQAGHADAASVPESLRSAMLMIVSDLYDNKEAQVLLERGKASYVPNPTVRNLLSTYKQFAA